MRVVLERAAVNTASSQAALGEAVRDGVEVIRTRAVRNVSGYPVTHDGRVFRVRVQTGALKGAVESEWPYGSQFAGRVFINGAHTSVSNVGGYYSKPTPVSRYARAIEEGHGPIDLKKTMQGKTVPFFGARAQNAQGPYTERGLVSVGDGKFISSQPRAKAHGKGPLVYTRKQTRTGSAYFITFRKVGKTGWIIPAAAPRPFLAAAVGASREDVRRLVARGLRETMAAPVTVP